MSDGLPPAPRETHGSSPSAAGRLPDPGSPPRPSDALRRCRAFFTTTTAIAALLILQRSAQAEPTGGSVVAGSAAISQAGSVTNINQSSSKAIINWQGFSVGAGETVNFNQPSSTSATLNRVIGNETSVISGALNANGQVFIVNSAGVLFGKGAQVNVGGLVASTLDISNENFMAGNYSFSGTSVASVVNQGRIKAAAGGYVALLGKTVANDGVISAKLGTVAMASGDKITLNFDGNSLVDVTIDQGTLNALVANGGLIKANGGTVIMTAKAADAVLSAQVNNTGVIRARTMAALKGGSSAAAKAGKIKLLADGGTTTVSGTLDASAPNGGNGGAIETSGNKVVIDDAAVITTLAPSGTSGTWLIDPDGFTIAASGGDITGAALSSRLATNGTVTIASTDGSGADGNIYVNDTVSWSTSSTLTLTATNSVYVNSAITASGASAGLILNATSGGIYDSAVITMSGAGASLAFNAANGVIVVGAAMTGGTGSNFSLSAGGNVTINSAVSAATLTATASTANAGNTITVNSSGALNVGTATLTTPSTITINGAMTLTGTVTLNSTGGGVTMGAPVTGGAGSTLVLNASGDITLGSTLTVPTISVTTAAGTITFSTAQTWTDAGTRTFFGRTITVNSPLTWSAGTLTLDGSTNININAATTWSGGTLTLNAGSNIYVNAPMTASGSANLFASYGYALNSTTGSPTTTATSGSNSDSTPYGLYMGLASNGAYAGSIGWTSSATSVWLNGQAYTVITTLAGLDAVTAGPSGSYVLGNDLSGLSATDVQVFGVLAANQFTGNFNGFGHTLALASVPTITIDSASPLSVAALRNTNLVLSSTGDITINSAVTSGAGLLTFNAGGDIHLNAPVATVSDDTGSFAFAGRSLVIAQSLGVTAANIFINAPTSVAANTTLTLTAGNAVDLNAAIVGGAGTTLAFTRIGSSSIATINVNAALDVATLSGYARYLNFLAAQNWSAAPSLTGLNVSLITTVSGALTWTTGTLTLATASGVNINAPITGTGAGAALVLKAGAGIGTVNINAAVNVPTISVTSTSDTTISAAQNWSTAPTLTWAVSGNLNIYAPLTWSSGTLTLTAGANINVNAVLTGGSGSALVLKATKIVNVDAVDALNASTVSVTAGTDLNLAAAQDWSALPTFTVTGNINVDGEVTYKAGTLTLKAGKDINVNAIINGGSDGALILNAGGTLNIRGNNALDVTTIGITTGSDLDVYGALSWSTLPAMTVSVGRDINIEAGVSWSDGGKLALAATGAINVTAAVGGGSGSGLQLNAGGAIALNDTVSVATLTAVAGGDVTVTASPKIGGSWTLAGADINVSAPLVWSAGTLTLSAAKDIYVNAAMTATGSATFVANYGYALNSAGSPTATATSGSNADGTPYGIYMGFVSDSSYAGSITWTSLATTVALNGQAYTVITTRAGLDAVAGNLSGNYVLGNDLAGLGAADVQVFGVFAANQFTGLFNGFGHTLALASVPTITVDSASPLSVAALRNTNLVLSSTGDITINAPVTSGAGLLTFSAANNIYLDASLASTSDNTGSFALAGAGTVRLGTSVTTASISGSNLFIDAPVTWSSSAALTLTAKQNIYINAPITASGDGVALTLAYGSGYNYYIRTPASYAGTSVDANGNVVANSAPAGTTYGSITLSGTGDVLTIGNQTYTLVHSLSELASYSGISSYYAIANDIDANGTIYSAAVMATLNGTLAGLGHTISNLTIGVTYSTTNYSATGIGLIGRAATGSIIRDIGLTAASVTVQTNASSVYAYSKYVGTLVGYNSGNISNSYAIGTITTSGIQSSMIGGLVGFNVGTATADITISDSYADVTIKGSATTGGLVGRSSYTTISNSDATGDVTSTSGYDGGLVGYAVSTSVYNSYAAGAVAGALVGTTATTYYDVVGGLIGIASGGGTVSNSFATGNVSGGVAIGGLIGEISSGANSYSVINSHATGAVTGYQSLSSQTVVGMGGLIGYAYTSGSPYYIYITDSYATGSVRATGLYGTDVGGLVGNLVYGVVTGSYATGSVRVGAGGTAAGGLIGQASGSSITNSHATGDVSGGVSVGGLVGGSVSGSIISGSYATGNVTAAGINAGGLVGANSASAITDSYATGNVSGGGWSGGLAGTNTSGGVISDSYSTGTVTSLSGGAGGVVGYDGGVVNNSYYNADKNPGLGTAGTYTGAATRPTNASGLTTGQFKDVSYYQNGTINQVLADRAAAAAAVRALQQFEAAAAQTAGVAVSSPAQTMSAPPPNGSISAAGQQATISATTQALDENIKAFENQTKAEDRRARERMAHSGPRSGSRGSGFGATIRSIDVDGQRFDLNTPPASPEGTAPAPAGPQQ